MLQFYLHVGLITIYTVATTCLGVALLKIVRRNCRTVPDISCSALLASAFFLGQGILANIWLLVSLTGYFTPWVVLGVLGACIVVGGKGTAAVLDGLVQSLRSLVTEQARETWIWQVVAGASLILVLATAGKMLIMPLAGDAITFYLPFPKLIAYEQAMVPLPCFEWMCTISLQGEMHWAALFLFGIGSRAVLFTWPVAAGTACLLLNLATLGGVGRRGQWIVLAMLFASTTFTFHVGDGKVDLFGAGLGVACAYWLVQAGRLEGPRTCLVLAGAFAGLAVIAKLSLLVVLAPASGTLLLWHAVLRTEALPGWRAAAGRFVGAGLLFGPCALAMLIPHVIKNAMIFDEPFAPFVVLHGPSSIITSQCWFSPATTAKIVAIYPLALVYGRYPMMGGNLSPLLLMFAPLLIFLPRPACWRTSVMCQIACLGVVGLVAWLVVRPSVVAPRYILPPLFLLMIPLARAAEWACSRPDRPRLVSLAVVGAILSVSMIHVTQSFGGDSIRRTWVKIARALCGTVYQNDNYYCQGSEVVNEHAGDTERVFVATYNTVWLRDDLLARLNGQHETAAFASQPSVQERWEFLHRQGFRFVLLDRCTHPAFVDFLGVNKQTDDLETMPCGIHVEKRFQEGNLAVYELRALPRVK